MKKLCTSFMVVLSIFAVISIAGCKKNEKPADVQAETEKPVTVAQILAADFKAKISADEAISMEALAGQLMENSVIEFGPAVMPVEPGYLNGFTNDITDFSEGCFFGPMIGAIPFAGYVFRTDNAEVLAAALKADADLRWNICTQADEMVCEIYKDVVFFVMAPLSFEE